MSDIHNKSSLLSMPDMQSKSGGLLAILDRIRKINELTYEESPKDSNSSNR